MSAYSVDAIIAHENGELDPQATLELFASIVESGIVNDLQGHYGRTAHDLIEAGYLSPSGAVLVNLEECDA